MRKQVKKKKSKRSSDSSKGNWRQNKKTQLAETNQYRQGAVSYPSFQFSIYKQKLVAEST